ncbi:hypothetical protein OV760_29400, partial [Salmonella enterica subsp. enterica serovar 1,4,[5],12:i:-]|nr:hypothetical protein [Salmonella enterica subsp. enterica serovar 1,4,[5],12:i:-]
MKTDQFEAKDQPGLILLLQSLIFCGRVMRTRNVNSSPLMLPDLLSFSSMSVCSNVQKDSLKVKLDWLQCHFTWALQKENIDLDDMKQRLEDSIQ